MKSGFTLTEGSLKVIHELVKNDRRVVHNTQNRPGVPVQSNGPIYLSPEVYIGLSLDGIPACVESSVTAIAPGVGQCGVYEFDPITGSIYTLNITLNVYNFYTSAVSQNAYIPIIRDKIGNWLVASNPGSSGGIPSSGGTINDGTLNIINGSTLNLTNSTENVSDSTINNDSSTVINNAGTTTNYTANSSINVSTGETLTISGGGTVLYSSSLLLVQYNNPIFFNSTTYLSYQTLSYSTTQNNVSLTANVLILQPTASGIAVTGLVAPASGRSQIVEIINDSAYTATISNNNTGSSAANRFTCPGAADYILQPGDVISAVYDGDAAVYRIGDGTIPSSTAVGQIPIGTSTGGYTPALVTVGNGLVSTFSSGGILLGTVMNQNGTTTLGSNYTVTVSWTTIGMGITLPAQGTYLVIATIYADLATASGTTIECRFSDSSGTAGTKYVQWKCGSGVTEVQGNATLIDLWTVSSSVTLSVQAQYVGTAPTTGKIMAGGLTSMLILRVE